MLQLNLHPSRYFLLIIMFVHVAAVMVVLALPLQWWAIVLIEALIAANFVNMIQKHIIRKSPKAIVVVLLDQTNHWILMNRAGEQLTATLLRDTTSSQWLVTLNFRLANDKRVSVLVFPDSVDKVHFRHLRQILKSWKF